MEHKVTYKNPDGTLQEVRFNDFDQFADSIDQVAQQYYNGLRPNIEVETKFDDGFKVTEKVTNDQSTNSNGVEFLQDWVARNQRKIK